MIEVSNINRQRALQTLGLPEFADLDMIKKAYHMLCKKYHPDESGRNEMMEQFLAVQNAYEYLCNDIMFRSQNSAYQGMRNPQEMYARPITRRESRIIGTGSNPEREKGLEKVRSSGEQMEALQKRKIEEEKKKALQRKMEAFQKEEEDRLYQKRVKEQLYKLAEVIQLLDESRKKENNKNAVYARKKAYEAFQKYEERNQEAVWKDPIQNEKFYNENNYGERV